MDLQKNVMGNLYVGGEGISAMELSTAFLNCKIKLILRLSANNGKQGGHRTEYYKTVTLF